MQPDAEFCCPTKRKGKYPGKEEEMAMMRVGFSGRSADSDCVR